MKKKASEAELVASLAEKTPDYHSDLNAHHLTIIEGELSGQLLVKMDGGPFVPRAQVLELEGQTVGGVVVGLFTLWSSGSRRHAGHSQELNMHAPYQLP